MVGRPRIMDDPQTVAVELAKSHRDYILDFLDEIERNTGFRVSRSAAVRRIIEEHRELSRNATSIPKGDAR